MKIQSLLRPSLLSFLFLLLTAERCVEITDINAPNIVSPGSSFQVKTRLKHISNADNQTDFALAYYLNVAIQLTSPATVTLDILNLSGRIIESFGKQKMDAGQYTQRIELAQWPSGIYLVRTGVDGQITTRKVVKN